MRTLSVVDEDVTRWDFPDKMAGKPRYSAGLKRPEMRYGPVLRSSHTHANIVGTDTGDAVQVPGVPAVISSSDAPRRAVAPIAQGASVPDSGLRFVVVEVAAVADEDRRHGGYRCRDEILHRPPAIVGGFAQDALAPQNTQVLV